MILARSDFVSRAIFFLRRISKKLNLWGFLTITGVLCSITGFSIFQSAKLAQSNHYSPDIFLSASLFILLLISIWYVNKANKIPEKIKGYNELISGLHSICHKTRDISREWFKTENGIIVSENNTPFTTYAKLNFNKICTDAKKSLEESGIKIDSFCIKYFNDANGSLEVIGASDGRESVDTDQDEKAIDNPFFSALLVTHYEHTPLSSNKHIKRLHSMNKSTKVRFLGIEGIEGLVENIGISEFTIKLNNHRLNLWLVSRICGNTQVPVTCQVRDIRRFVGI